MCSGNYLQLNSGPEGIRTPDLFSAIEARSQLRYRPGHKANDILPEADGYVKQAVSLGGKIGRQTLCLIVTAQIPVLCSQYGEQNNFHYVILLLYIKTNGGIYHERT